METRTLPLGSPEIDKLWAQGWTLVAIFPKALTLKAPRGKHA